MRDTAPLYALPVDAGATRMPTRRLGQGGPEVSALGLGCNSLGLRIGEIESREVVEAALDEGITFFDTADLYGRTDSERLLGEALGTHRAEVVVATKWGYSTLEGAPRRRSPLGITRELPRGSPKYLRWALESSLERLGTDWIDLYQYHRLDGVTPLEETFAELAALVREGKIRWVGLPALEPAELEEAVAVARRLDLPVVSMQLQYSLAHREPERELLPLCERLGIGVIAYLPLHGGLLTGKYRRDEAPPADSRYASMPLHWPRDQWLTDEAFDQVEALERFAAERGISLLEVALGGLVAMPAVATAIAGATRPEHVHVNAAGVRWVPSEADLAELRGLGAPA
jgi:aryl-alcohol dehydrogenase-like predicted oxidoreductase